MVDTTIKVSEKTVTILKKLKIHPRQSYDEVLKMLIKKYMEEEKRGGNE